MVLLFVVFKLFQLFYFRESNFSTAVVFYFLPAVLVYVLYQKFNLSRRFSFSALIFIVSLFIAECFLRFVLQYPQTYTEQNGAGYISQFKVPNNLFGKDNNTTFQFEPFEMRNYDSPEFDYPPEKMNEYGFRGKVPSADKKIILALGDSFTEGIGAPADSTYPYLLNQLINGHDSNYAVFNAGTAGNDPFFDFTMLKKLHQKISFHEVLFLINTSDVNDVVIRGGMERFVDNGLQYRKAPFWEPFYAVSYVFRLFAHNLFDLNYNLMTYEKNDRLNLEAVELISVLFKDEIVPFTKENDLNVKVVLHPFFAEFENPYHIYDSLSSKMSRIEGLNFYDSRSDIIDRINKPEEIYWMNDAHFKPRGYAMLSRLIFKNMYRDSLEN